MDCCAKPNIAVHDYRLHDGKGAVENRVCLKCGRHWHAGREYTRFEWDDFLNGARELDSHVIDVQIEADERAHLRSLQDPDDWR